MNIVILNGSPKGELSITLQYVNFLRKKFPYQQYYTIHVAQKIKTLVKNESRFLEVVDRIREADAVIWSFGLWVLAVPAQYMRFIELISERGVEDAFHDKHTVVMSTSIHYFDHTAHNYMRAVCEDLKMRFVDNMSYDIMDLQDPLKRQQLMTFAETLFAAVEKETVTPSLTAPLRFSSFEYQPTAAANPITTNGKQILVLTDGYDKNSNLGKMIDRFRQVFSEPIDLIDLHEIEIRGACIGCMKCGYDYTCQYKDGFTEFYNNRVRTADVIVMAGDMKGRYLSSLWKTFFDRAFFWNHTPSLEQKQIAYLISGPLSQSGNLVQILEASVTARQNANLTDIITDECENSRTIDAQLDGLAEKVIRLANLGYVKPQNFLAVGGQKIFRDDIWGRLRGLWQADHRYYKKSGFYDFPQKKLRNRLMGPILILLTKIPSFRKAFYNNVMRMPALRLSKLVERT